VKKKKENKSGLRPYPCTSAEGDIGSGVKRP